jgi:hypothetical protein
MHDLAAQRMPADYYRRQAAQARRLADEATTPAVKQHLRDLAAHFERLVCQSSMISARSPVS